MPTAPLLPPDQMAQAQAGAGLNPAMFLMAAASMHNDGQLSAPVPTGKPLGGPAKKPTKRTGAYMKVVK